jgi:hypothetical protein
LGTIVDCNKIGAPEEEEETGDFMPKKTVPSIYQIRMVAPNDPSDLIAGITHAVWAAITEHEGLRGFDVHHWQTIYDALRHVFSQRLAYYPECGRLFACGKNVHRVYLPQEGRNGTQTFNASIADFVYTLNLRRGLSHFVLGLTAVILRSLRDDLRLGPTERRGLEARLITAIERALSPSLFYSHKCKSCWVREASGERWLWADSQAWR